MKVWLALLFVLALAPATAAADAVSRTVDAPEDRVWAVTEAVDKDQPMKAPDQTVEKTLLADIGKSR